MRKYFPLIFIFSILIVPLFASAAGDIVINEIQLLPTEERFIELYNSTDLEINMTNWYIQRKTQNSNSFASLVSKTYFDNKTIGARGYFLISRGSLDGADIILNDLTLTESNTIQIKNFAQEVIDKVGLGDAGDCDGACAPNPVSGQSIQRMADGTWITAFHTLKAQNFDSQNSSSQNDNSQNSENISNNSSSSFSQNLIADAGLNIAGIAGAEIVFDGSKSINSSGGEMSYSWNFGNGETASGKIAKYAYKYPGRYIASLTVSSGSYQNSDQAEVLIYPAGIFINEFLPSPEGADEENEWIEIANDSDSIADISDFQLGDGSDSIFKIPKNTYIAPRSFLVFSRKATKISLNNDEDKVILYYPNGEIADSVEYKDGVKEGFSAARTGGGRFLWTKNSTPGTANMFLSEPARSTSSGQAVSKTSAAPVQKIVSENKAAGFKIVSAPNFSVVDEQLKGNLISFLPEVSAKTVDGYDSSFGSTQDESDLATAAGGLFENGAKTNQSAFLIDSLKNKTAAALILIPSIILSAIVFIYRRKFWK